jgi:hypothetical protein
MFFQPAIIALIIAALASSAMLLASLPFAVRVLRHWDLSSGSEAQLAMERRTYLVATLVKLVLVFEVAGVLLFIFNADRMASLFTGAMCAVGTLNVDRYGFPALYLKITTFFLASGWLALNFIDNRGYDYPLARIKYGALLVVAPVVTLAAGIQLAYFSGLRADVITSCCSTLFSGGGITVTTNSLATLSHTVSLSALAGGITLTLGAGAVHAQTGRGATVYGVVALGTLAVALAAVVSTISVYVYELPHHHCPFCLLKNEYGHIGYLLYVPLFGAAAFGVATSLAGWARRYPSLADVAPTIARRFTFVSMAGFAVFGTVSLWLVQRSNLILFEQAPARLGGG